MGVRGVATVAVFVGIGAGFGLCFLAVSSFPNLLARPVVVDTEYQAVLLTSGEAFYGRLAGLGSPFPVLTDVYYVQQRPRSGEQPGEFVLVKRGKEWHRPDRMFINARHILFIEPVHPESSVAQTIRDARSP